MGENMTFVANRYYLAWCFISMGGKQLPTFQLEAVLHHLRDTGKGFVSQDFWGVCVK